MRRGWTMAAAAALTVASPTLAYKLVRHDVRVAVAKSALTVQPAIDWNRQQSRPGRDAEAWTLDGLPLNEVTFYGGIPDGRTLFREVNKRDKPLPRFSATMLAPDVIQLFEQSYRLAGGSSLFAVEKVEPATLAGNPGFRFEYSFTLENEEVKRRGEGVGAIVGGELYLVTYEAPVIHYFEKNVGDYRAIVATARIDPAVAKR